jgi:hypothetical protein
VKGKGWLHVRAPYPGKADEVAKALDQNADGKSRVWLCVGNKRYLHKGLVVGVIEKLEECLIRREEAK